MRERCRLSGDERLFLALESRFSLGDVLLGDCGEIGVMVLLGGLGSRLGGCRPATQHLLGHGGVVAHILLGDLGRVGGVLASDFADLAGLGRYNVRRLLNVVVDELLVCRVDERHQEEHGRGNQGKTPVWDDLDEVVREEGGDAGLVAFVSVPCIRLAHCACWVGVGTHGSRGVDILCHHYSLSLDDEEIGQFVDVADHGIKSLPGNGVVLAGSELARDPVTEDGLTDNLGGNGDAEHHPCELEHPSEHVEVPNREDEGNDGGVGNGRGPCENVSSAWLTYILSCDTYVDCSMTRAPKRRSGSVSGAGRWPPDWPESVGRRRDSTAQSRS